MNEYPLHWYTFENDIPSLKNQLIRTSKAEIDVKDLRGKTALELAVFMDHFECAKLLVEHGADCSLITKSGWNLVQESVSTGNAEMIKLIMTYRDFQRTVARTNGIPELLNKLKQAPDFYVEMKWEFTSWIPLISKACPSDIYKIYKSGSNVRIDTTLIGFNGTTWERGNRSYIFQANDDATATIIEIDHIMRTYHLDKLTTIDAEEIDSSAEMLYEPDDSLIQNKLTSPNIVTFLDIEKIEFERNRSGIWGWRTDKNENINGYDCKVYTANNLQLVTKTRVEHLNSERAKAFLNELEENDLSQLKQSNGTLPGFLTNFFQGNEQHVKIDKASKKLTALEYFQKQVYVDYYLNGSIRNIDETRKIQTFNANLSLCETYPLSLHEQVLPIVDLMALNNSHFKKLKEFITLQLPSGFPVKIEIPLYRVITAKVTFGNIHALDHPVECVTTIKNIGIPRNRSLELTNDFDNSDTNSLLRDRDDDGRVATPRKDKTYRGPTMCIVDESIFKIPSQYRCTNAYLPSGVESNIDQNVRRAPGAANFDTNRHYYGQQIDDDDILLQLAIQQSLSMTNSTAGTEATGNSQTENEDQLTALEMLGHRPIASQSQIRDSSGSTQSLQEYHERRNNRVYNQTEEDLVLQRVLAESLMASTEDRDNTSPPQQQQQIASIENVNINIRGELLDDALVKAIELSRREEEERRSRMLQEDEELKKS